MCKQLGKNMSAEEPRRSSRKGPVLDITQRGEQWNITREHLQIHIDLATIQNEKIVKARQRMKPSCNHLNEQQEWLVLLLSSVSHKIAQNDRN